MCGITGIVNLNSTSPILEANLRQMLAMIRHRGPDQFGIYHDEQAGLGSARLSIIDLAGGQQPICNEDGSLWIVFNGEIFNYIELRSMLEARGHRFTTHTDTEVILHLIESFGPDGLHQLNGQFAIAIWDAAARSLFLARDRMGIRPLFYTEAGGALIFGSEIKAILADPRVRAEIDPVALDQIFTYWSTLSPRTIFKGIASLPPGHYLLARRGRVAVEPYWQPAYPTESAPARSEADYLDEFRHLLTDATHIRLRADVPVGAYLSGGLDSAIIGAMIRRYTGARLDTFSIAFDDPTFDESAYQQTMARHLGTSHQVVQAANADIGRIFPGVVWHTETPIVRTAPAPMFMLSQLVQQHGYKVVLTGEGADELLAGYNIFKEAKIRRFWAVDPNSVLRPQLLRRLYPFMTDVTSRSYDYLTAFFKDGMANIDAPDYSHAIRWRNMQRTKRFFSPEVRQAADPGGPAYPPNFDRWQPLHRAQYLETTIFLAQYLLSSQGDRMGMAHSIEGRFPFLDYRLVEFCHNLPPHFKLRGLTDKYLLRKLGRELLPAEIWQRPKRPYQAPMRHSFFNSTPPDYLLDLLSAEQVAAAGLFKPAAVGQLVNKIQQGIRTCHTDDMALVGIISSQLLHRQFVANFKMPPPLSQADDVKVCQAEPVSVAS
ncbi:MAG: Asparagine synthetase [glutamine-hydrolyzing] 1 [Anaerolineae bacterium]|nr:Asparagine synthetase [glutamine-hydrolyzing] 1 [Anaerolineae bacterium]